MARSIQIAPASFVAEGAVSVAVQSAGQTVTGAVTQWKHVDTPPPTGAPVLTGELPDIASNQTGTFYLATSAGTLTASASGGWNGTVLESATGAIGVGTLLLDFKATVASGAHGSDVNVFAYVRNASGENSAVKSGVMTLDHNPPAISNLEYLPGVQNAITVNCTVDEVTKIIWITTYNDTPPTIDQIIARTDAADLIARASKVVNYGQAGAISFVAGELFSGHDGCVWWFGEDEHGNRTQVQGAEIALSSAPRAPDTPTTSNITAAAVDLAWAHPADVPENTSAAGIFTPMAPGNQGQPVSGYSIQYRAGTTGGWTTISRSGNTATSYTVSGLAASTLYQMRVAAENVHGTGGYSGIHTVTTGA